LLRGIPDHAVLRVEATLHPEDAAIQQAVLALSMPSLAEIHVTPVVPHDSYVNKVPALTTASDGVGGSSDVLSPTEREVMEQCLQEQLADVANLVVEEVAQRTGRQLDALQVSQTDEMRNFAEIILHSIQDELRQLRLSHSAAPRKGNDCREDEMQPTPSTSLTAAMLDVEAVAAVVSARVMERLDRMALAPTPAAPVSAAATQPSSNAAESAAAALSSLERRTTAYFEQLQSQVQQVISSEAAVSHAAPAAIGALRAAVMEAVEVASTAQQENLANLVNDWLADMQRNPPERSSSSSSTPQAGAAIDMRALEEAVESAVQSSTDELRHIITSEVKKLSKSRCGGGSRARSAGDSEDSSQLLGEVEKVFDLAQSTQSRLAAVDEVVGDVFKEQAATREALQTIQELLQKQLSEVRTAASAGAEATPSPPSNAHGIPTPRGGAAEAAVAATTSATMKAVEEAVAGLQREVAAASAIATVHQEEAQQQLVTLAQVVSDSVSAAVQQHTTEAVQAAMATVQQQLESLAATAQASADAAAAAAAAATATTAANAKSSTAAAEELTGADYDAVGTEPAVPHTAISVGPLSKEIVAEAVEAVLTPRWSKLSAEVKKMNTANQLAIEEQLLHMANSVAAAVTTSLQEQLEAARVQSETASAAAAAAASEKQQADAAASVKAAEEKEREKAELQRRAEETKAAAVSAATALAEKTTQELTNLREELMSTLQSEMRKSHEVDLTPMYRYIDSVLTFMKEELNTQEATLSAKITSLAGTVTAAVREAQERPQSPQAAAAQDATNITNSTSTTTTSPSQEDNKTERNEAALAAGFSGDAAAAAALSSPPPSTLDIPASLSNTLDFQTNALRHLEERLNELSLSQSRDMSLLLTRLQEATADFRAAATPAPPSAPLIAPLPHPDQLAWQKDMTVQLTTLGESLKRRDAELRAAVHDTTASDAVRAQLTKLEETVRTTASGQRDELQAALRTIVFSSAEQQSSQVKALTQRVAEMHDALRDQAVAVQLLRPSPALRGLTAEQQSVQARIQADTQSHLRRITAALEEVVAGSDAHDQKEGRVPSPEVAARLQTELKALCALQKEEAALHRDATAASPDPAATVESIVASQVLKTQTVLEDSMRATATHYDETQKELAATLATLLAKVSDIGGNTSSVPSTADIQQLLDATLVRLTAEQKDAGEHVVQLVAEATTAAATNMKSVVQSTVSESISTSVEQRILPLYHEKVEGSLKTHLLEQTAAVTAAVAGVTDHTTAAIGKVETLVRDFSARRADEVQKIFAEQQSRRHGHGETPVMASLPVWWMLVNALLVCVVVLLSLYYVFACLLLAFVPKPSEVPLNEEASLHHGEGAGERVEAVAEAAAKSQLRRGSRYVDRYM
jgi:trimeric autotransporter adhesin